MSGSFLLVCVFQCELLLCAVSLSFRVPEEPNILLPPAPQKKPPRARNGIYQNRTNDGDSEQHSEVKPHDLWVGDMSNIGAILRHHHVTGHFAFELRKAEE